MIVKSIRGKLEAYAELRRISKLEALNEALDRALSISRAEIKLGEANREIENYNDKIKREVFFRQYKVIRRSI